MKTMANEKRQSPVQGNSAVIAMYSSEEYVQINQVKSLIG